MFPVLGFRLDSLGFALWGLGHVVLEGALEMGTSCLRVTGTRTLGDVAHVSDAGIPTSLSGIRISWTGIRSFVAKQQNFSLHKRQKHRENTRFESKTSCINDTKPDNPFDFRAN